MQALLRTQAVQDARGSIGDTRLPTVRGPIAPAQRCLLEGEMQRSPLIPAARQRAAASVRQSLHSATSLYHGLKSRLWIYRGALRHLALARGQGEKGHACCARQLGTSRDHKHPAQLIQYELCHTATQSVPVQTHG